MCSKCEYTMVYTSTDLVCECVLSYVQYIQYVAVTCF